MVYQLKKASVLVIDDMQPLAALVASILGNFGFTEIHQAYNGKEGLELFNRHNPDLIITDWLMEPMDGIEMVRRIRKEESPNRFVPVIMMTGFSHKMRVEQARDAGITEFLVKPFRAKDLLSRIEQLIEKPRRFVDNGEFFGPDRRRRLNTGANKKRRDKDAADIDIALVDEGEAAALLRDLQEQAKDTAHE